MQVVSDKTSEYIQMLGGLDRLPNFGETVFPWFELEIHLISASL